MIFDLVPVLLQEKEQHLTNLQTYRHVLAAKYIHQNFIYVFNNLIISLVFSPARKKPRHETQPKKKV